MSNSSFTKLNSNTWYIQTNVAGHTHQYQRLTITLSNYGTTGKKKVSWDLTTKCTDAARSPTYYVAYSNTLVKINNEKVINWPEVAIVDNGHHAYRVWCDENSKLDNRTNKLFEDFNGDYVGIHRWCRLLGTKWASGSFIATPDENGRIKFPVYGEFGWSVLKNDSYGGKRKFSATFNEQVADIKLEYDLNNAYCNNEQVNAENIQPLYTLKPLNSRATIKNYPTTDHYICTSWNTSKSGTGAAYASGATYSTNTALKLYATWQPKKYYVKYFYSLSGVNGTPIPIQDTPIEVSYGSSLSNRLVPAEKAVYGYEYDRLNIFNPGEDTLLTTSNTYINDQLNSGFGTFENPIEIVILYSKKTVTTIFNTPAKFAGLENMNQQKIVKSLYGEEIPYDISYLGVVLPVEFEFLGWSTTDYSNEIFNYDNVPSNECTGGPGEYIDTPQGRKPEFDEFDISEWNSKWYIKYGECLYIDNYKNAAYPRCNYFDETEPLMLYPVIRHRSTLYIFDGNSFKLALPYVYVDGRFKMAMGYCFDNNKFKL